MPENNISNRQKYLPTTAALSFIVDEIRRQFGSNMQFKEEKIAADRPDWFLLRFLYTPQSYMVQFEGEYNSFNVRITRDDGSFVALSQLTDYTSTLTEQCLRDAIAKLKTVLNTETPFFKTVNGKRCRVNDSTPKKSNTVKHKMKPYEIVLLIVVIAAIIVGLLLPKTGPLVIAVELCDIIAIWGVCVFVVIKIVQNKRERSAAFKAAQVFLIAICIAVGVLFTRSAALDLASGPEMTQLTDIQVSKTQAHTGIFSLHYYLTGTDETGQQIRLEISADDYTRLSNTDSLSVEYYANTNRLLSYSV